MRELLVIISGPGREAWAQELKEAAPQTKTLVFTGSPEQAARHLASVALGPSHIILDIGSRGQDVLNEIDLLAQHCEVGTRLVAVGDTNDIVLYRGLISRGVVDYMPMPAAASELLRLLTAPPAGVGSTSSVFVPVPETAPGHRGVEASQKRVIAFMSAASGDGASTAALNTAYSISQIQSGRTVLVDMDYQFGMVARHLDLQSAYGIRELFDHPERGVDAVLIKRMIATHQKLHVITAPSELRYVPPVTSEMIRDLIAALKLSYDTIILDLPHVWMPWVAAAAQQSTHLLLVAQLWLKSVSHASRLMRSFRELAIPNERVDIVINRSGAKFKEAIYTKDFEKVCNTKIRFTLANDTKTIVGAEATARTVMEMEPSPLSADITALARSLLDLQEAPLATDTNKSLLGRFMK